MHQEASLKDRVMWGEASSSIMTLGDSGNAGGDILVLDALGPLCDHHIPSQA
jgi:hypothetical protein